VAIPLQLPMLNRRPLMMHRELPPTEQTSKAHTMSKQTDSTPDSLKQR